MQIVTGCNQAFYWYAANLAHSLVLSGHEPMTIYDLDGLMPPTDYARIERPSRFEGDQDAPWHRNHDSFFARSPWKPEIIALAVREYGDGVLWLDADCLVRESLAGDFDDCDMAVTIRTHDFDPNNVGWGFVNTGVVYATSRVMTLIEHWARKCNRERSDQELLMHLLIDALPWTQLHKGEPNRVIAFEHGGAFDPFRMLVLPSKTHNDYQMEAAWGFGKILHFKGVDGRNPARRKHYECWLRELGIAESALVR